MQKKYYIFFILCCFSLFSSNLWAQSTGVPLNSETYHIIDRLDIKGQINSSIHPEIKIISRDKVVNLALQYDSLQNGLSKVDRSDLQYIFDDSNEWLPEVNEFGNSYETRKVFVDTNKVFFTTKSAIKSSNNVERYRTNKRPILKYFYQTPANLFEVNTKYFRLKANPMLNFNVGKSKDEAGSLFQNTRGIELRGDIDKRFYFYTSVEENQIRYANYTMHQFENRFAISGAGAYKYYVSNFFKNSRAFDFTNAQAYIGVKATNHIGVQMGHGQNFIGNGYRSLFLSDNGANYFFLKFTADVWRFKYQSIFSEMSPTNSNIISGSRLLPKKYTATHYLNYNVNKNLSFGLFETIIFNRKDHFEFQYLNPVILYRTVESVIGSPDNVMLGLDGKWNFGGHFQLYGQLLLDEFNFQQLYKPDSTGWWANKYGVQAGLKYMDVFGINHLDLQVEYNKVRPYAYAHFDTISSYTHFRQPLAHPLGANFREMVVKLRYKPTPKLLLQARGIFIKSGESTATQNWGDYPMPSYDTHVQDYGNFTGQGIATNIKILALDASWQLYHNIFLDLRYFKRSKTSTLVERNESTNVFGFGVRINAWNNTSRTDF
jgi:hypothetical protein